MVTANSKGESVARACSSRLPRCIFCGRYDGRTFRGRLVCDDCLEFIRNTF